MWAKCDKKDQSFAVPCCLCWSKGLVEKITILKSSGYEILDNESTNTIKRWKFKPAVIGDKPVNDVLEIPIKFVLDN